jgi:hypothetical protein
VFSLKTVIYGITDTTQTVKSLLASKSKLIFASTNGDEVYQHEVVSLEDLSKMDRSLIDRIIICSQHVNEITNGLLRHNFELDNIYFFNHHDNSITNCSALKLETIKSATTLYAIYDMDINIPSYDVFTFIVLAEQKRIDLDLAHIHFVVVPANSSCENDFSMNVLYDSDDFGWRMKNLVIPAFSCLPSCKGYSKLAFRQEITQLLQSKINLFPASYSLTKPKPVNNIPDYRDYVNAGRNLAVLKAPAVAAKLVTQFLKMVNSQNKKLVVIVLRELQGQKVRNNNIDEWARFSRSLDREHYSVLVLRDSYNMFSPLDETKFGQCSTFPLASNDVTIRVALYEKSYIVMGVSSGALYPAYFIKGAKAIKFQFLTEHNPTTTLNNTLKIGLEPNKDPFFVTNKYQKLIWKSDSSDNIKKAFNELVTDIESTFDVECREQ